MRPCHDSDTVDALWLLPHNQLHCDSFLRSSRELWLLLTLDAGPLLLCLTTPQWKEHNSSAIQIGLYLGPSSGQWNLEATLLELLGRNYDLCWESTMRNNRSHTLSLRKDSILELALLPSSWDYKGYLANTVVLVSYVSKVWSSVCDVVGR